MARQGLNKKMGNAHEEYLVEVLGGRKTKSSGNQWQDPMDGRHSHYVDGDWSFAWDGKSTLGKSIGVSREMIEKAMEQAGSEIPLLALRFYRNESLEVDHDWVAIEASVFKEMLELLWQYEDLRNS